jgi:hypothetical protein
MPAKDADLLTLLDLERIDLATVAENTKAGRTQAALEALLDHFRQRISPSPLAPSRFAGGSYADEVVAGNVRSFRGFPAFHITPPYNWDADPFNDYETTLDLARQGFLTELAAAYVKRHDPQYVKSASSYLQDWIDNSTEAKFIRGQPFTPVGRQSLWMPKSFNLNSSERLNEPWPVFFFSAQGEPLFPPDLRLSMLRMVHAQAEYILSTLTLGDDRFTIGNRALVTTGILFPEFKRSRVWLDTGWQNLSAAEANLFAPDGAYTWLTPLYELVSARSLVLPALLARRNDLDSPPEYRQRLRGALDYLLGVSTPEREVPTMKLSSRSDLRPLFEMAAALFPEDKGYAFLASGGTTTPAPDFLSRAYRYSGHVAFRSGWGSQDTYMLLDLGPMGGVPHEDALSLQLDAYGAHLIVDPGRHSYNMDPFDVYMASSAAHSVILVDGKGQDRASLDGSTWFPSRDLGELLRVRGDSEVASGTFGGPWKGPTPPKVRHSRQVVFVRRRFFVVVDTVRPDDGLSHTYQGLFQLGAGSAQTTAQGHVVFSSSESPAGLVLARASTLPIEHDVEIRVGSKDPISGWHSPTYGDLIASPTVSFRSVASTKQLTFVTALVPFQGTRAPRVDFNVDATSGGKRAVVRIDGERFELTLDQEEP